MATLADTIKDVGAVCLALGAIFTLVALVERMTPVRWVWRRLASEPFAAWLRSIVRAELERTNGGSSFYDRLVKVEQGGDCRMERLTRIEQALGIDQEPHPADGLGEGA